MRSAWRLRGSRGLQGGAQCWTVASVFFGACPCGAGRAAKAGRRRLFGGGRAPLSPCSSEIEFGRVRPTSLLHSTVHSLIPCGAREEAAGNGGERQREGGRGGVTAMEEGGKWMERDGEGEMFAI